MKKVLLPIDGTKRSQKSIEFVKALYKPNEVDITILMVREDMEDIRSEYEMEQTKKETQPIFDGICKQLSGYNAKGQLNFGRAGEAILDYSNDNKIDIIIMTKSTRNGWSRIIGSVTTHVVKYAKCIVMIVPEV